MALDLAAAPASQSLCRACFTFCVNCRRREMYSLLVTRVCESVCLSLAALPHYCTDPDVTWVMVGVPSSCALLSGFAIGARVSLLWQHRRNAKCQRVLVLALCLCLWDMLTHGRRNRISKSLEMRARLKLSAKIFAWTVLLWVNAWWRWNDSPVVKCWSKLLKLKWQKYRKTEMILEKNYMETVIEMMNTIQKLKLKWLKQNFIETKTEMIINTGI